MKFIVKSAFSKAKRVIDRFHIQKLVCDAVQEIRIVHRWNAILQSNEEMRGCKQAGKPYVTFRYSNGDTCKELLVRSRYLLFKSAEKWTRRQKEESRIEAVQYNCCHLLWALWWQLNSTSTITALQTLRKNPSMLRLNFSELILEELLTRSSFCLESLSYMLIHTKYRQSFGRVDICQGWGSLVAEPLYGGVQGQVNTKGGEHFQVVCVHLLFSCHW